MKKTIFLLIFLLIPIALAIDECERTVFDTDVPCLILLPNSTSCDSITISFYQNTTFLYTQTMSFYESFNCNVTFNQTEQGVYTFLYSTGDTGTITVTEDIDNRYYLYLVAVLFFFGLLFLGYYLEDGTPTILAGMLSCILAINLYQNGFPLLTNEFLKHCVIMVLLGLGFYFILAPSIEYFENLKGTFGGKME